MKSFSVLLGLAIFTVCEALVISVNNSTWVEDPKAFLTSKVREKRALSNSQPVDYAPIKVSCPRKRPAIRSANGLSSAETAWLKIRRQQTVKPMTDWLSRLSISNFDAKSYINTVKNTPGGLPNIGIAISGGGYRSLMTGAGFLAAADVRTTGSSNPGHIGGLLQSSTYLAGLSGGGWLVSSMYANNFSTVESLRDSGEESNVWKFENSIMEGPDRKGKLFDTAAYIKTVIKGVFSKRDAGFNISATDFWGRALSFQLINAVDGGPSITFSSIASQESFKDALVPFPIMVAIRDPPNQVSDPTTSNVFEMNPYELGTWDNDIFGFAPMEFLGTKFSAGTVSPNENCVKRFDQIGFLLGTTSTLFHAVLSYAIKSSPTFIRQTLLKQSFGTNNVAQFQPNPFSGFNPRANSIAKSSELSLVDGGLDGQNLPLLPLLQPKRKVDVILAIDSSADSSNYPNGTSLVATYRRLLNGKASNPFPFPTIPDEDTFVNLGLSKRPTLFGCDGFSTTDANGPLIVYIPNTEYSVASNFSTFKNSYGRTLRDSMIQNGYEVATQANGTKDPEWPACLGCAILSRSITRTKRPVPATCSQCFDKYCWKGSQSQTAVKGFESRAPLSGRRMAEKYLLRVTAGSSYNYTEHQVVPVNSPKTISINSELISVNLNVRIQSYRGIPRLSPKTSPYFSLPAHAKKNDQYSISFVFSPKSTIDGDSLVFGNDFDHPVRDRLPPGFNTAFRIVKWLIDPGLDGDIYADKPYLYGPLGSSINILYVGSKRHKFLNNSNLDPEVGLLFTEGGCEEGNELRKSKKVPDTEASRRKYFLNQENRLNWEWEAGREYGCDFFNPYLDFNIFALRLPGFSISMMKFWDGSGLRNSKDQKSNQECAINSRRSHTLRYTLKDRSTNTILLVVAFTVYLKEDVNEDGSIKEDESFDTITTSR